MKNRFVTVIGMILIMASAVLPVHAAAAVQAGGLSGSSTAAGSTSLADLTSEFRYLGNGWH